MTRAAKSLLITSLCFLAACEPDYKDLNGLNQGREWGSEQQIKDTIKSNYSAAEIGDAKAQLRETYDSMSPEQQTDAKSLIKSWQE